MIIVLSILALAFFQNAAGAMASRSRNRDNRLYHVCCATVSNGMWFLMMREVVMSDMNVYLLLPYLLGTVAGSLTGAEISMYIEKRIGAKT